MQVIAKQKLFQGVADTSRATGAFTSVCVTDSGRLIVTYRTGTHKDAADGNVDLIHSDDGGATWSSPIQPFDTSHEGTPGSLRGAGVTQARDGRLLAGPMWFDRSDPDKPLFNPQTEGLLPCRNFVYESHDDGATWSFLSVIDTSNWEGLPTYCAPIMPVNDNTLAAFLERNKTYDNTRPWHAQAVVRFSHDGGRTWPDHAVVASDPQGKRYYWDQRMCVADDDHVIDMFWTFDRELGHDVNIHMATSKDGGRSWTQPADTGLTGQIAWPAVLPDGRLLIAYIDRFGTRTIRCRVSPDMGATWPEDDVVELFAHESAEATSEQMGDYLQDMNLWTFGHPCCRLLPDGDVGVVYYGGGGPTLDVYFARVRV